MIFWNWRTCQVEGEEGAIEEKEIPFMWYYTVFNLAQIDGIAAPEVQDGELLSILSCEEIIKNMPQAPLIPRTAWPVRAITRPRTLSKYRPRVPLSISPLFLLTVRAYFDILINKKRDGVGQNCPYSRG